MTEYQKILDFWFVETPEERWFREPSADFDQAIRDRFEATHVQALAGELDNWAADAPGALALVITLDQFPRNIYRGTARAFAADAKALAVARGAVEAGLDGELTQKQRVFLYLPFEHAEDLAQQRRSVELYATLDENPDWLTYAERHLVIIERFGRFPHRNEILGRATRPEEAEFLKQPNSSF